MNGGLDHALDVIGFRVEQAAAVGPTSAATMSPNSHGKLCASWPTSPTNWEARQRYFIDGWSDEQAEAIANLEDRYVDARRWNRRSSDGSATQRLRL